MHSYRATSSADDPDFSPEIVADLYRHHPCSLLVTTLLAVFLGPFGAHRFYCGKTFTGTLMLLTFGGVFAWWIWDLYHLRSMVDRYNAEGERRQAAGLPSQGLGFLPPQRELKLNEPPAWASRRAGRGRIVGSAMLLYLLGLSLGTVSSSLQMYEPVLVLILFIAASLLAARWPGMAELPLLHELSRWVHRLRLYYHTVDPGPVWRLATRPVFGVFFAAWRPKARAEVRLYLQLGAIMALLLAAFDALELLTSGGFWFGFGMLVAEFAQTFIFIYLFVAPAGALLTTQLLLARRDQVVWLLSAITVFGIYTGYSIGAN